MRSFESFSVQSVVRHIFLSLSLFFFLCYYMHASVLEGVFFVGCFEARLIWIYDQKDKLSISMNIHHLYVIEVKRWCIEAACWPNHIDHRNFQGTSSAALDSCPNEMNSGSIEWSKRHLQIWLRCWKSTNSWCGSKRSRDQVSPFLHGSRVYWTANHNLTKLLTFYHPRLQSFTETTQDEPNNRKNTHHAPPHRCGWHPPRINRYYILTYRTIAT